MFVLLFVSALSFVPRCLVESLRSEGFLFNGLNDYESCSSTLCSSCGWWRAATTQRHFSCSTVFFEPLQYEVRPETSVPQKVQTHFPTTWRPTFLSVPWNLSASNYSASEKPTYERSAVPKVLSSPVPLSSCLFLHHGACGLDGLETS